MSRFGLTAHLHKDFTPLLNDIGLMFQVVFGGLTDVYLHALLRQTHKHKTTAKARVWKDKRHYQNHQRERTDLITFHCEFFPLFMSVEGGN